MDETQVPGVWLLLAQLGKRIFRRSDEDEMGIPMRHFLALGFLRGHEGLSQQALTELMCTDANNLVIVLNELEADGLATRRRDPLDRRRHIVEITPAGRNAVARAEKALAPHEADVLSGLTLDERAELRRLMIRALGASAVAADAPPAELVAAVQTGS
jgi:MarR family transcriptional regulator, temperature-dependent positive regulator of motility